MPIDPNPFVYKVVLSNHCLGVLGENVFYYSSASALSSAADCSDAFDNHVLLDMITVASEDLVYDHVHVECVKGGSTIFDQVVTEAGSVLSHAMPPYVSWAYRFNRVDVGERHGYKRPAGVPEGWWAAGTIDPTNLPTLNALATVFQSSIAGAGVSYRPVIQERQHAGVPVVPAVYHTFDVCSFVGISSQNTRKK